MQRVAGLEILVAHRQQYFRSDDEGERMGGDRPVAFMARQRQRDADRVAQPVEPARTFDFRHFRKAWRLEAERALEEIGLFLRGRLGVDPGRPLVEIARAGPRLIGRVGEIVDSEHGGFFFGALIGIAKSARRR